MSENVIMLWIKETAEAQSWADYTLSGVYLRGVSNLLFLYVANTAVAAMFVGTVCLILVVRCKPYMIVIWLWITLYMHLRTEWWREKWEEQLT